ncbi:putative short chain oxidoreductase [Aspergillus steynii IBT 23096]|uniref:Putative short chain oxidoreductase n=1 Tax=Aspergillus steynii IBT 23096 TaxID=1392250 RepID=A0A2I2G0Z0_9EURO|nr:putative short chain oxidoreductase [Aspergillus steynii IBT 23096]PLB46550.1 putative short chain oxidoreductase [Aspergillus steynii IBT 23096]
MSTYLVTGSSRGLGFNIVNHLASRPASQVGTIFATSRQNNSAQLQELVEREKGRVVFVQLDAARKESVSQAVREVEMFLESEQQTQGKGKGLDVVINNAGIMPSTRGGIANMDDLNETFNTNVTSAHMVTSAFLPLLRKGERRVIANISTTVGSIAQAPKYKMSPTPAYKITKAALNMLTVQYAQELEKEGFTVLAISPGWLKTEMAGGDFADLPVSTGAEATMHIIDSATREMNGKFLNIKVPGWEENPGVNRYDGKEVPW